MRCIYVTFLSSKQARWIFRYVTTFSEVELVHGKDTGLKQDRVLWFQEWYSAARLLFVICHPSPRAEDWNSWIIGARIIYRTKVRLMPDQSSLYCWHHSDFGAPVAHLRIQLVISMQGRKDWVNDKLTTKQCLYLWGKTWPLKMSCISAWGRVLLWTQECRDVLVFIHNIWGCGCMDKNGYLPVHAGLCVGYVLAQAQAYPRLSVVMSRPKAASVSSRERTQVCKSLPLSHRQPPPRARRGRVRGQDPPSPAGSRGHRLP